MNKGFTLIETLTAIVLMSAIMMVAIPSYNGVSTAIKTTNYNTKKLAIESAMLKFANEHLMDDVKPAECRYNCEKCYDLYDFIVEYGIYASEKEDDSGLPIIINPMTGLVLEGCVNITYVHDKSSLEAEFILGGYEEEQK